MTDLEYAKSHARSIRYAERVRYEERLRAFDILETCVDDDKPEAALALYYAAAKIMGNKL